jgi:hypothetical protein
MTEKMTWKEFRDSGFLWFINQNLHVFGLAIAIEVDTENDEVNEIAYPVKTKFRGFSESINNENYEKLTNYVYSNERYIKEAFVEDVYLEDSFINPIQLVLKTKVTKSNAEAKRLLYSKTVKLNYMIIESHFFDPIQLKAGDIVTISKRNYRINV